MARSLLLITLLLFALNAAAEEKALYRIDHLEPASWWVGMKNSRLQLMVHGVRIGELEPALDHRGVSIERVIRIENPNYLFVDLTIAPEARPGRFRIDLRRGDRTVVSHEYILRARDPGSAARSGFGPADAIYLITPDRFANGDAANDRVAGYRQGPDRREPFGRHGGDLQGVRNRLDYIAGMGFTQIWLNPVLQNDQPEGSYHGYATSDFYAIDARFGDNALYRTLSLEARQKGIGLIMDVILNHCGSEHWWMKDLPSRDWINHEGRFVANSHNHESLHDPHGTEADRSSLTDGWFVPTMPDLNQRNPLLATYLIQNSLWWIEFAALSGLRVDTWPYSERDFLVQWTRRVTEEYPRLNIVGEEWSVNPAIVAHWQRGQKWSDGYVSHLPSLMDFPLQDAVVRGLVENDGAGAGLPRIYSVLASDFLYPDPYNLVVFPDNHDMSRIHTQLGERLDLYKMAMALFATTRGIAQFYYGTEILMTNPGTDSHGVIRSDFPGGWAGDRSSGFTGGGLSAQQREAQEFTRAVLNWRKGASAIQRGKLTQYAPQEGAYVYFRHDERQKIMIVINKAAGAQRIDTARFRETIRTSLQATDVLSGRKFRLEERLEVPGRSVTILELRSDDTVSPGVTGRLERHEKFASRHVDPRNVDVWLPPGYEKDGSKRFAVVYMHDGQNLFDPSLSYTGIDWGIDETMTRLIREGIIREAIVVGVWNTSKRFAEYMPQKAVTGNSLSGDVLGQQSLTRKDLAADAYLRFLVGELKPFIDSTFRTRPGREDTFIMGAVATTRRCPHAPQGLYGRRGLDHAKIPRG